MRGTFAFAGSDVVTGFAADLVSTICISPTGAAAFTGFALATGFAVAVLVAFDLAGFSAFGAASVFAIGSVFAIDLVDTISILASIAIGLADFVADLALAAGFCVFALLQP